MTTHRLNDCGHGTATVERSADGLLSLVDIDPPDAREVLITVDLLRDHLHTLNTAQAALNAMRDYAERHR